MQMKLSVPSTVLLFPPAGRCWWSCPSCCPGSHFPEPACGSGRRDRSNVHNLRQWKHTEPQWNAVGPPSQIRGCINLATIGMQTQKSQRGLLAGAMSWSIFSLLISRNSPAPAWLVFMYNSCCLQISSGLSVCLASWRLGAPQPEHTVMETQCSKPAATSVSLLTPNTQAMWAGGHYA